MRTMANMAQLKKAASSQFMQVAAKRGCEPVLPKFEMRIQKSRLYNKSPDFQMLRTNSN